MIASRSECLVAVQHVDDLPRQVDPVAASAGDLDQDAAVFQALDQGGGERD